MSLTGLLHALADPPEPLRALQSVPGLRLVGGWLRQAYFGQRSCDLDLTCEQPLDATVVHIAQTLGAEPFALNERYPTRRLVAGDYTIDVSQLTDANVEADIARRDYTCNTLMLRLDRLGLDNLADTIEGHPQALADIESHTLRMVSRASLTDDPLRLVRGYRLCATERFEAEPRTREAWKSLAPLVRKAAAERIHDELLRWFAAGSGLAECVAMCAQDGVLWQLFPLLEAEANCIQAEDVDVWAHTLECLRRLEELRENLPPALEPLSGQLHAAWNEPVSGAAEAGTLTRIALLLHDCAKPATRDVDVAGKLSFYDHQNVGAALLLPELQALKFSGAETDYILTLVREHLRLGFYTESLPLTPRLIYRYIRRLGRATPLMLLHSVADCMATRGEWTATALPEHIAATAQILHHYYADDGIATPPLLLNGDDIMDVLQLPPSKLIGELKDALLEATASGEVRSRDAAVEFVRREHARHRAGIQ
jgi:tRNA nucleotidyltransferase/poly(A) polymerase